MSMRGSAPRHQAAGLLENGPDVGNLGIWGLWEVRGSDRYQQPKATTSNNDVNNHQSNLSDGGRV